MKNKTILNLLLTVFASASILACASKKTGASQNVKNAVSQPGKIDISLNVSFTSNYCGGAAPSDEMLEKLKIPKKFSNQNFFISTKEGLEENMREVTTSVAGVATAPLEKGTYYVFLPQKVSMKHTSKDRSEEECKKWKNTPNATFTVGDQSNVSFTIHKTCDRCGALRM